MRVAAFALLVAVDAAFASSLPSFDADIAPVLRMRCASCHMTGTEAGNIALGPDDAYENLVGVASPTTGLVRVTPGKPEASYLLMKLDGTGLDASGKGKGMRMPLGATPLPEESIRMIRDWIAAGAPRN
jgi:hypothetical protein